MPQGKRTVQSYLITKPMQTQHLTADCAYRIQYPPVPPELPEGDEFSEWEFRTDERVVNEVMGRW